MMTKATTKAKEQAPTSIRETYQDWVLTCQPVSRNGSDVVHCQVTQELRHKQSGQRVLTLIVTRSAPGRGNLLTVSVPFGVLLKAGLDIEVDGSVFVRGEYLTCLQAGCVSEMELSDKQLATLFAKDAATAAMITADKEQSLKIAFSLKGFAAAWDRMCALSKG